jgi:NADH-quinone oxidoreductase subunit H
MFYVGGLAATKRAPFDLPEAESELVAGYHTEYSGLRFSFFFMSEYAAMYVICALATVLFLGGWHGPIPRPALPEGASLITMWGEAIRAGIPGAQSFIGKFVLFFSSLIRTVLTPDGLRIVANEVIGAVNLLGKAFGLYFIIIWVRWTLPRIRIDQVMYLCLKVLLPIGLVCVIWAVVQVAVFP